MGRWSPDQATDCGNGSTDWTTLGARIRQVAALAAAAHLQERAAAELVAGDGSPPPRIGRQGNGGIARADGSGGRAA